MNKSVEKIENFSTFEKHFIIRAWIKINCISYPISNGKVIKNAVVKSLYEIDKSDNTFRIIQNIVYNSNGKVVYSYENNLSTFSKVVPESTGEMIVKEVIDYYSNPNKLEFTKALDAYIKKGYFIPGNNYKKFSDDLTFIFDDGDHKIYKYKEGYSTDFLGLEFSTIILRFKNNILEYITLDNQLEKDELVEHDLDAFLNRLIISFGESFVENVSNEFFWKDAKYNLLVYFKENNQITIVIF